MSKCLQAWIQPLCCSLSIFLWGILLVLCVPASVLAEDLSVEQIIHMHEAGLPVPLITSTIQSTGATFNLSASDVKKLRKAKVPKRVIDIMASTNPAAPTPQPAEPHEIEAFQAQEDSERGRRVEEARIRKAALRAAAEEKYSLADPPSTRNSATLASARDALKAGQYEIAAVHFDKFLATGNPGVQSSWDAKLGMANALFGLGLYSVAAELYHDILSAGPENAAFVPAFEGLRACSKKIEYNPVTLEALTNNFIGDKTTKFQNSYNYFVGKFFFGYKRYDTAKKFLESVSNLGSDYPRAQYLLALIMIEDSGGEVRTLLKASRHLVQTLTSAQENGQSRLAALANLALARVAYSVGTYDLALYYYRRVPQDSAFARISLEEAAWPAFFSSNTLILAKTLDKLDATKAIPQRSAGLRLGYDRNMIEANVLLNNCQFKYAERVLNQIDTRFLAMKAPLARFITEHMSPEAMYKAFVLKESKHGIRIPDQVRRTVINNPEFHNLYEAVTQYGREMTLIEQSSNSLGDALSAKLFRRIKAQEQNAAVALGLKIEQLLQGVSDELDVLGSEKVELEIDIYSGASEELEKSIEQTFQDQGITDLEPMAQGKTDPQSKGIECFDKCTKDMTEKRQMLLEDICN